MKPIYDDLELYILEEKFRVTMSTTNVFNFLNRRDFIFDITLLMRESYGNGNS